MQVRGECIGAVLVLLCLALPTLERQLSMGSSSGGRRAAPDQIAGAAPAFVFDDQLPDAAAKELAWASFACLRNTNTCALLLVVDGRVALARGAVSTACASDTSGGQPSKSAQWEHINAVVQRDLASATDVLTAISQHSLHFKSRQELSAQGLDRWSCIPEGVQGACIHQLGAAGSDDQGVSLLIALTNLQGGYEAKDTAWLAKIADKIGNVVQRSGGLVRT